ncbi:MAG: hypothetical protein Q9197_004155 [Variospora fuerteventurae]
MKRRSPPFKSFVPASDSHKKLLSISGHPELNVNALSCVFPLRLCTGNFADTNFVASRNYDEKQDYIGSESATPSGVATPRPDPVDKRFPGIVHSFFGQPVGQPFGQLRGALPTAPCSPSESHSLEGDQDLGLLAENGLERLSTAPSSNRLAVQDYPTPPASSSSSSTHKDGERVAAAHAITTACGSRESMDRPALGRLGSGEEREVIRTRRQNAGLNPLSNIVTSSPVHASHIFNPASRSASITPNTPTSGPNVLSAHSALNLHLESLKLTDGVATPPRKKSTPPRTPRALSSDGSEPGGKRVTNSSPRRDGPNGVDSHREIASTSRTKAISSAQSSPPVGPPKGRLSVKISEARGLKPSYDPYAVCVFEYNEAVARHPKAENVKGDKDDGLLEAFPFGGVPINRSSSDIGRSMAIPMKSRQSSTTSLSDQKNFKAGKQVTNPKWDHEAMFDVLSYESDIDVYIYDRSNQEAFLGHVRVTPNVSEDSSALEGWYKLEARDPEEDSVSGEIHLEITFQKTDKKHFGPEDFQIIKLIGKGS